MEKGSIKKNYLYNMFYQIVAIIVPFITTPYLSRVLGAEAIGVYGFVLSIVTYFVLLGSLGINLYASREIAYNSNSKEGYTEVFWSIFKLKAIMMLISLALYVSALIIIPNQYTCFYLILIAELIANTIDISWLYQGLELFKKTTFRNVLVKIIGIILIFSLIKTKDDLYLYFIIYALSALIGNASLWIGIGKILSKKTKKTNIKVDQIKGMLLLFIPQIAIQLSGIIDKTMLGIFFQNKTEVGYYEQSQKILLLLIAAISSLGIVLMPNIASNHKNNKAQTNKRLLKKSISVTLILSIPLSIGVAIVADSFVPIYYGDGYERVILLLQLSAPLLIIKGLSENIGKQFLLAMGYQRAFVRIIMAGFVLNMLLNMIFIAPLGANGAIIATLISEVVILISQYVVLRKVGFRTDIFNTLIRAIISGIIMALFTLFAKSIIGTSILSLILTIAIGGVTYFACILLCREPFTRSVISNYISKRRLR